MPQIKDSDYPADPSDEADETERGRVLRSDERDDDERDDRDDGDSGHVAGSFVGDDIDYDDDDADDDADDDDDFDADDDDDFDADDDDEDLERLREELPGIDELLDALSDAESAFVHTGGSHGAGGNLNDSAADDDDYDLLADGEEAFDAAYEGARPLLEVIAGSLDEDGCLPLDFTLPRSPEEIEALGQEADLPDGTRDALMLYQFGFPKTSDNATRLVRRMLRQASDRDFDKAIVSLNDALGESVSIMLSDTIADTLAEFGDAGVNLRNVFEFALVLLCYSSDVETVKIGLIILQSFDLSDVVCDLLCMFALSDEFTLFVLPSMTYWEDANEDIFALAQRVNGWGRIHCVNVMHPDTQEIRDWLLEEGWRNTVMAAYSAPQCFERSGAIDMLRIGQMSDEQFEDISQLLIVLIDEDGEPVPGMSALPDQEGIIDDFLRVASERLNDGGLTDDEREAVRYARAWRDGEDLDSLRDDDYGEETGEFEVYDDDDADDVDDVDDVDDTDDADIESIVDDADTTGEDGADE